MIRRAVYLLVHGLLLFLLVLLTLQEGGGPQPLLFLLLLILGDAVVCVGRVFGGGTLRGR